MGLSEPMAGRFVYAAILIVTLIEISRTGQIASHFFAEERRNNTLGLLFSTGITATEVLVGKLAALLIIPLSRLITIIPCLMVLPLMHAVTADVCIATFVTFLVLLLLSIGVNLFSSLVFEEHSSARTFADIFIIVLVAIGPTIDFLNRYFTGTSLDRLWLCFSPAYAPWLLFHQAPQHQLHYIYLSNFLTGAITVILFAASAVLVARIWRDQTTGARFSQFKIFSAFKQSRTRASRVLLESNPYQWLVERDFQPMLLSCLTLGAIAIIWLLGLWHFELAWLVPLNFWATLLLVGSVVRWMSSYIAAKQIGRDRTSGGLELLLTSPLSIRDIIIGQENALRRYIRPLFWLTGALHILFFVLGLLFHPMPRQALINYTLISIFVAILGPWFNFKQHWTAFWISLNTGRPGYALRKNLWENSAYFTIGLQLFLNRDRIGSMPSGSFGETIFVAIVSGVVVLCYIFIKMGWDNTWSTTREKRRDLSIIHLRNIAAEPVPEATDPRLKKWDHSKPLYERELFDEKILV
jgi:hypothetical protein